MKKNILLAINIFFIIVGTILFCNILMNNILISKYNNENYSEGTARSLLFLNIQQGYIANYNYANVLYKNGKYEEAIEQYKKALKKNIPTRKECDVRINYALSICNSVVLDENDKENIKEAIKKYESAIDVLVEDGCAIEDNNTVHNPDAIQLKKDIEKEIERLKELLNDDENEGDDNKDVEKDNQEIKSEDEVKSIEEKIQQIKDDATKEQRSYEDQYIKYSNYSRRRRYELVVNKYLSLLI